MPNLTNKERMDQITPFIIEMKKACKIDMASAYLQGDDNESVLLIYKNFDSKRTTHVTGTDGEIKMFLNGMIGGCNLSKKPPF